MIGGATLVSRWGAKLSKNGPGGVQKPKIGCIVSFKPILAKKIRIPIWVSVFLYAAGLEKQKCNMPVAYC